MVVQKVLTMGVAALFAMLMLPGEFSLFSFFFLAWFPADSSWLLLIGFVNLGD
jgi:hypothetical protein